MAGRSPDYDLALMNKRTNDKLSNAGSAWKNEDGSISIKVKPFIVIPGGNDLVMMLFPITAKSDKS